MTLRQSASGVRSGRRGWLGRGQQGQDGAPTTAAPSSAAAHPPLPHRARAAGSQFHGPPATRMSGVGGCPGLSGPVAQGALRACHSASTESMSGTQARPCPTFPGCEGEGDTGDAGAGVMPAGVGLLLRDGTRVWGSREAEPHPISGRVPTRALKPRLRTADPRGLVALPHNLTTPANPLPDEVPPAQVLGGRAGTYHLQAELSHDCHQGACRVGAARRGPRLLAGSGGWHWPLRSYIREPLSTHKPRLWLSRTTSRVLGRHLQRCHLGTLWGGRGRCTATSGAQGASLPPGVGGLLAGT